MHKDYNVRPCLIGASGIDCTLSFIAGFKCCSYCFSCCVTLIVVGNIFTTISDLFPKQVVGIVTGFATTVSTLGGMLTALLIGYALNESGPDGYKLAFAVASCGYLVGIAIIHILVPNMKPVKEI